MASTTAPNTPGPDKVWWKSKTVIFNLVALLSLMVPAVAQWLKANPVEAAAVVTAINTLLRFATQGKVIWLEDDSNDVSGGSGGDGFKGVSKGDGADKDSSRRVLGVPWLVALVPVAILLLLLLLPGCTPAQRAALGELPLTVGVEGEYGTYTYNRESGFGIMIKGAKVTEQKSFNSQSPITNPPIINQSVEGKKALAFWDPREPHTPRRMCLDGEAVEMICDPRWQLKERRKLSGERQAEAATGCPWVGNPLPRPL